MNRVFVWIFMAAQVFGENEGDVVVAEEVEAEVDGIKITRKGLRRQGRLIGEKHIQGKARR